MTIPLAIVGCGKMGCLVDQLAPECGFEVRAQFSRSNINSLSRESLKGATIAIEFTTPSAAPENLCRLAALGVSTVCGTTGWYEHLPQVREKVIAAQTALVYAANFSVGVNLFLDIVGRAATLFAQHPEYQAWGWEIHHSAKKDAPSGTLKKLAEEMRQAGFNQPLAMSSNRAGAHPGTHEIGFDSQADTITLRHTARSREGFARGALQAARWIVGKQGVFEFREILTELRGAEAAAAP
ncbi:MAG TPA: dihydrodipicolinate reductase C-terminal domain-containing protein [Candidatus Limnocylindrales bacterium]|nr:dihydrodipicolinate reductase C-terminal domain-containing protein [Candidatus Limnocylindrales bacterium]